MPKSNFLRKKSKTGATADFKRLKAKVGKRAPQAASHTDTSFKSKRVRVSAQSILHELGDDDAVTARGQGVQELLVQLRHYSPISKREALAGLKTIVDRHRGFAEVNFARLAEASLELAVIFDDDVRKALLTFQEALLRCVSARTFSPFANLYMAYVVSAMSNLDRGVRRDSLALLALLLARFPTAVADRADRLAPNYPTLLAVDPASKKQTGRLGALKSLVGLFRAVYLRYGSEGGVPRADGGVDDGVDSGGSSSAVRLLWKRRSRRNGALMLCSTAALSMVVVGDGVGGGGGGAPTMALASILPPLLERLREVWIEALAAVPPDIGLMQSVVDVLLEAVASPAWTMSTGDMARGGGGVDGGRSSLWFSRFVPLVLEVFPVRPLEGELLGDTEAERLDAIQALNMGLCELVVAACTGPAAVVAAASASGAGAKGFGEGEDTSDWLEPVLAHVHEVLRDRVGKGGAVGRQIPSVLRVLSAATHSATGKANGSATWTAQRQRLLAAFGDFFESLPPRAEAKLSCVRFVCDLTSALMSSTTRGGRIAVTDLEAAREVRRWLQSLPELLCCWDGEFPESSAVVLKALVGLAKHAPAPPTPPVAVGKPDAPPGKPVDGKARGKTATPAQTEAVRAGGGGGGGGTWATVSSEFLQSIEPAQLGELFSGRSFLSLPASAQTDAVSLLFHLPSIPACVVSALGSACSEPAALSTTVRSFVLEVMHHRRRSLTPSEYLGFLVSILTGFTGVKRVGGSKRTAAKAGVRSAQSGGGKRRRRKPTLNGGSAKHNEGSVVAAAVEEEATVAPVAPPTLWDTVFARDEVTGGVCSSLAMIGTRGGALLDVLRPTLLRLLRQGSGGGGNNKKAFSGGAAAVQVLDEGAFAVSLQGQRAAMACVLCCWEGLEVADTLPSAAPGAGAATPESPLSPLERPIAEACVQAMKTAGTAEAAENSRGARLLRPVLVLVKRWPALLPAILTLIANTAPAGVKTAAAAGEREVVNVRGGASGFRSLEPLLRCLQVVVRDPGLQGQLRRRHLGGLRLTVRTLGEALDASPLKDLMVELQADVELLGSRAQAV